MLQEGQVLGGKYRLDGFLHNSGASTVWAATNAESRRQVALKVLSDSLPEMPEAISRFVQDGRNASKPLHPMIVRIEEVGHTGRGIPFMVMELLEGRTLREELDDRGVISLPQSVAIMKALLEGLAAAHGKGAVHGNLKPENIYLEEKGDELELKILNFGISRAMIAQPRAVAPKQIIGRLDYIAPEILMNPGALPTPASDVFACGVIFAEMINGSLPLAPLLETDPHLEDKLDDRRSFFSGGNEIPPPSEKLPTLLPAINSLAAHATKTDPRSRPAQASQVLSALQGAIANDADLSSATIASTFGGDDDDDFDDPTMLQGGGEGLGGARTMVAAPAFDFDSDSGPPPGGGLDAAKTALFDAGQHGDIGAGGSPLGDPFSGGGEPAGKATAVMGSGPLGDPFEGQKPGQGAAPAGPPTAAIGSNMLDEDGGSGADEDDKQGSGGQLEAAKTMMFDSENPPSSLTQKLGSGGGALDEMAKQASQGLGEPKTMLYQGSDVEAASKGGGMAATMVLSGGNAGGSPATGPQTPPTQPPGGATPDWAGGSGASASGGAKGQVGGAKGQVGAAPGLGGWVGGWQPGQGGSRSNAAPQPAEAAPKKGKGKLIIIAIVVLLLLGLLVGGGVAAIFVFSGSDSEENSSAPADPPPTPAQPGASTPIQPGLGASASSN